MALTMAARVPGITPLSDGDFDDLRPHGLENRAPLWFYVLREMQAGIAGLGTMGTPVVGLLLSWAQLGERPTIPEIVGMIVILGGLAILFARGAAGAAPASRGRLAGEKGPAD